jgi:hypothetical protein
METETEMDLKAIADIVHGDIEVELRVEIIWSSMIYLKRNPEKSIQDAIDYGYNEWIK